MHSACASHLIEEELAHLLMVALGRCLAVRCPWPPHGNAEASTDQEQLHSTHDGSRGARSAPTNFQDDPSVIPWLVPPAVHHGCWLSGLQQLGRRETIVGFSWRCRRCRQLWYLRMVKSLGMISASVCVAAGSIIRTPPHLPGAPLRPSVRQGSGPLPARECHGAQPMDLPWLSGRDTDWQLPACFLSALDVVLRWSQQSVRRTNIAQSASEMSHRGPGRPAKALPLLAAWRI